MTLDKLGDNICDNSNPNFNCKKYDFDIGDCYKKRSLQSAYGWNNYGGWGTYYDDYYSFRNDGGKLNINLCVSIGIILSAIMLFV